MTQSDEIRFARAAGVAGLLALLTVLPVPTAEAAPRTAPAPTASVRPAPQRLGDLDSHIARLHADCLKQAAPPQCTVARWWEVTAWVTESKELARADKVHLRELYLAVSRAWRGNLESRVANAFNRELAIRLMDRSRGWTR